MTSVDTDFSYEPFSKEPEYLELNRAFVAAIEWGRCTRVVDVACGTGTVTQLVWEQLRRRDRARSFRLVGVDLSRQSLRLAVEGFQPYGSVGRATPDGAVVFVEGSADRLPIATAAADAVIICNAIHAFPDPRRALTEAGRVLRAGGTLAVNSSFFAGTFVNGTERFYTEWMKEAVGWIWRRDIERRRSGLLPIARVKGTAAAAFSRPWLSADEYQDLLRCGGFRTDSVHRRPVTLSQRALEAVGSYAGLASVLLSGYPVAVACQALQEAVAPALATVGAEEVPRYWLELVARKTGRAPR